MSDPKVFDPQALRTAWEAERADVILRVSRRLGLAMLDRLDTALAELEEAVDLLREAHGTIASLTTAPERTDLKRRLLSALSSAKGVEG